MASQYVEPSASTDHRSQNDRCLALHGLPGRHLQRGQRPALERHGGDQDHGQPGGVPVLQT